MSKPGSPNIVQRVLDRLNLIKRLIELLMTYFVFNKSQTQEIIKGLCSLHLEINTVSKLSLFWAKSC